MSGAVTYMHILLQSSVGGGGSGGGKGGGDGGGDGGGEGGGGEGGGEGGGGDGAWQKAQPWQSELSQWTS